MSTKPLSRNILVSTKPYSRNILDSTKPKLVSTKPYIGNKLVYPNSPDLLYIKYKNSRNPWFLLCFIEGPRIIGKLIHSYSLFYLV